MATNIETKRKLRAIRRLSASFPNRTAAERLKTIEGIATGKLEPTVVRRATSPDLIERLEAGQASKSPRVGDKPAKKKDEPEKKRKKRGGHDREEKGGLNRSSDVNL